MSDETSTRRPQNASRRVVESGPHRSAVIGARRAICAHGSRTENDCLRDREDIIEIRQRVELPLLLLNSDEKLLDA